MRAAGRAAPAAVPREALGGTASGAVTDLPGTAGAWRVLALSVLLFGGIWPVTKHALAHATPLWFATGRCGLAGLCIAAVLLLRRRFRLPGRGEWRLVLALGLLQIGGFFALAHLAIATMPAGRTAVLANAVTVWVVPLSVLLLGERMTKRRWLASGLGLLGVAALAGPFGIDWTAPGVLAGSAMLLGAALSWSLAILAMRAWPARRPLLELLPWVFATGAALLLPVALWREPAGGVGAQAWPPLLLIGLFAAPVGTWATVEVQRRLSPVASAVGFLLVPAFGLLLATLWLGEPAGPDLLAGAALIVASVLVMARGG